MKREIWLLSILATNRCNLNCSYCYVKKGKKKISLKYLKRALYLFISSPGNFKKIIIGGGEITINPIYFKKIVLLIKRTIFSYQNKNIEISLSTNLTFLNKDILLLFEYFQEISVSLDGEENSHNLNRKYKNGKGSFKTVFRNLKILLRNPKFRNKIKINKVISPTNVRNLLKDMIFLSKFNSPIHFNIALGINGWSEKKIKLMEKQFNFLYKWLMSLPKNKIKNCFSSFFKIPIPYCPYSTVTLNPKGDTYPCEFLAANNLKKYRIKNVKDNHLTLDNLRCKYTLRNDECREERCLKCGQICLNYSFPDKKFLSEKNNSMLAKQFNSFVLRKYIDFFLKRKKIPYHFIITGENLTLDNLLRIDNFLITLINNFSLDFSPPFFSLNLFFNISGKKKIDFVRQQNEKKKIFDFSDLKITTNLIFQDKINISKMSKSFIINMDNAKIFLMRKMNNKNKIVLLGNLYEGISIIDF